MACRIGLSSLKSGTWILVRWSTSLWDVKHGVDLCRVNNMFTSPVAMVLCKFAESQWSSSLLCHNQDGLPFGNLQLSVTRTSFHTLLFFLNVFDLLQLYMDSSYNETLKRKWWATFIAVRCTFIFVCNWLWLRLAHIETSQDYCVCSASSDSGELDSIGHLVSLEAPNTEVYRVSPAYYLLPFVFEISTFLETSWSETKRQPIHCFTAFGMCRHSELWFSRRGEIAEAARHLFRKRDLKMRKSIAEVLLSTHWKTILSSLYTNSCDLKIVWASIDRK